jgi:hypothetical protein
MKTTAELNSLIPALIEILEKKNHNLGSSSYDGEDFETNNFYYEKDGWFVEVVYECCGYSEFIGGSYYTPSTSELKAAWGRVTEITAYHYDDDTEEETLFSDNDLSEIWRAIDNKLGNIA